MQTIIDHLVDYRNLLLRSQVADSSFGGEYPRLKRIVSLMQIDRGYVVDIAASDGVEQSCTLGFFREANWGGLAVEMDPVKFSKLAFVYARFPNARLARCRVTPGNVIAILQGFEVPVDFSLLNLDIDSYDLHVIDALLKSPYRPKIISMEINEKIPPPIFFSVDFDESHFWKFDHFFGCSLTAASQIVRPHGYVLESLQYNNAIFIRSELAKDFFPDANVEQAYDDGYRNRPDRKTLFPYNADVDCLLELSTDAAVTFLRNHFRQYEGKFTLRG